AGQLKMWRGSAALAEVINGRIADSMRAKRHIGSPRRKGRTSHPMVWTGLSNGNFIPAEGLGMNAFQCIIRENSRLFPLPLPLLGFIERSLFKNQDPGQDYDSDKHWDTGLARRWMQIIAIRPARKDQAFLAHDEQATLSVPVWMPPLIPHPSHHIA